MGIFDILKRNDINAEIENFRSIDGAILLDVREMDEFQDGHIPGSINVPLSRISEVEKTIKNHDTDVFVYCLRGSRSAQAVSKMKQLGFTKVKSIGGIASYKGQIEK